MNFRIFTFSTLLLSCFLAAELTAQEQPPNAGDKIITDDKNRDFSWEEWKERSNKHWQGLDIGINMLLFDDGTEIPPANYDALTPNIGKSFYFGLNLFEKDITLHGEYIKFISGLGFDFYNFQLSKNAVLFTQGDTLTASIDSVHTFSKNNLKSSFVTIPLLLAFNTNVKHSKAFHFAAGVILGYRLSGKQKIEYTTGNIETTLERKAQMHQNPWKVAATVRLGYANYHLFGNYALTNFFNNGEAPKAKSVVLGIKILPW
ncbi:PorT family protein [Salibacteraceae bacterium]|nr:PorT family protein [Salibacteraceae bacterium]